MTAELPGWVPDGVDVTVPNAARIYDYALGGYHNFAVDREFGDRAERTMPGAHRTAQANRAFLGRAVRWLITEAGIDQFLDIGSGIPTLGNVHEIAQDADPQARVVYVDIDPVAVAHGRELLATNPRATSIQADLRRPDQILYHREVTGLLDFSRPVAVLLVAVLHFVADADDPAGIIARVMDAVPSGSYLTLSHVVPGGASDRAQQAAVKMYENTPTPVHLRDHDQIRALLGGLQPVEPGIVGVTAWRPEPDDPEPPAPSAVSGVVARKP